MADSLAQLPTFRRVARKPQIITLIGGGGKTGLMFLWARCLRELGMSVVTTTTTKLCEETPPVVRIIPVVSPAAAQAALLNPCAETIPLLVGGRLPAEKKLAGIPADWLDRLHAEFPATFFLVEGDGSAGRSLKGHLPHEPVIPAATSLLAPVIGLDILGKPLTENHVHRPEVFAGITGLAPGDTIDVNAILAVLQNPGGYLAKAPSTASVIPVLNKLDLLPQPADATVLARLILTAALPRVQAVWVGSVRQNRFKEFT